MALPRETFSAGNLDTEELEQTGGSTKESALELNAYSFEEFGRPKRMLSLGNSGLGVPRCLIACRWL
jgi:hypothetical protein